LIMMVMLSYDTPEQKHQTFLRKEFERLGGQRIQYSVYAFRGENHECERVIRQMRRLAKGIPGDIRMIPMEESVWNGQVVISEKDETGEKIRNMPVFIVIW